MSRLQFWVLTLLAGGCLLLVRPALASHGSSTPLCAMYGTASVGAPLSAAVMPKPPDVPSVRSST